MVLFVCNNIHNNVSTFIIYFKVWLYYMDETCVVIVVVVVIVIIIIIIGWNVLYVKLLVRLARR